MNNEADAIGILVAENTVLRERNEHLTRESDQRGEALDAIAEALGVDHADVPGKEFAGLVGKLKAENERLRKLADDALDGPVSEFDLLLSSERAAQSAKRNAEHLAEQLTRECSALRAERDALKQHFEDNSKLESLLGSVAHRLNCTPEDVIAEIHRAEQSETRERELREERDILADRLIELEELIQDKDGTLRWSGNGERIALSPEAAKGDTP